MVRKRDKWKREWRKYTNTSTKGVTKKDYDKFMKKTEKILKKYER